MPLKRPSKSNTNEALSPAGNDKHYASGPERRGMIRNRVSIDERPDIVASRSRIGDLKGDTVMGKNHQGTLVT